MGYDVHHQETTMPRSPSSVNASVCDRFEEAWKGGDPPNIDDFLNQGDSEPQPRRDLLCDLVGIDLEKRWRSATARNEASASTLDAKTSSFPGRPRLSDYVDCHSTLGPLEELPVDLICQEYYVRKLHGDQPASDEYVKRWGHRYPDLPERLAEVDQSLVAVRGQKAEELLPERIANRFLVKRLLGKGAFGSVYLAFDERLHRLLAVKVPHRERFASPEDVEAYLSEARALAALRHGNIVTVHDADKSKDGLCFVVSEFIEGTNLKNQINEERPSHAESVELVATIAEALHHAHSRGIVHRDIKPANILIEHTGKPYVVDFGLALLDEEFGKVPGLAGTPAYMSPEQARGESHLVDGRSDIFSLGVVFYELLSGVQPFRHEDWQEVLHQVKTLDPRPPRQIHDTIPVELERVCLKALSKRATDRYATALDMATDLRHFQCDHKPADRPKGPAKIIPKGLRSFDEHDADFFLELLPGAHDRHGLPESLRFWRTRIEESDPDKTFRVGLIYGPSGCGKSSFVKAGLLPHVSDDVTVVFVEATADQTETRLMRGLRKRCPDLPTDGSLKDHIAMLRRGQAIPAGRKVLIVLDQFEQWFHANREEDDTELVQSLRQCDGGRVQCLVTVRDDFWMSATRFFRQLEVCLAEGGNSAAVDLFGQPHAKKVLTSFGQAFGKLPEEPKNLTPDAATFVDQAVSGLAIEGKIICVRLALFAEMMKGKPWTPCTLRSVGGFEGLGVNFLEETFSAVAAPPEHRLHQQAARRVLEALLPEQGTEIKGSMRSSDELREASGYARCLEDYERLMGILDGELRLVTPTDPEGIESEEDTNRAFGAGLPTSPKPPTEGLPPSPPSRPEVSDSGELVGEEGDLRSDACAGPETRAQQSSARRGAHDLAEAPDRSSPRAEQASSSSSSLQAPASSLCYYQLTHDYLVPSLRRWLTRKQRETRRGRAELRLAERSSLWNAKPENRHLPSVWEWANIRLLTGKRSWTETQRTMMAKADRRHLTRIGLVLSLTCILAWTVTAIRGRVTIQQSATRAAGLVRAILDAETAQVPRLINDLEGYRRWSDPLLTEALENRAYDSGQKLHARLALLPVDPGQTDPLFDALLVAKPDQFAVIRDALGVHKESQTERLWDVLSGWAHDGRDPASEAESPDADERRFRAACALAMYSPDDPRWEQVSSHVAEHLVSVNTLHIGPWTAALRRVRESLLPWLSKIFVDKARDEMERSLATTVLQDYGADRLDVLVDLIADANQKQFAALLPLLKTQSAEAMELIGKELDRQIIPDWNDPPLDPSWRDPDASLVQEIEAGHGLLENRFAFCQTMPLNEFIAVAEALRASGYRPTRCRPYAANDGVQVAAVWARDGREWQIDTGMTVEEIRQSEENKWTEGFVPVDVAGYVTADDEGSVEHYAAVWLDQPEKERDARIYAGVPYDDHRTAYRKLANEGFKHRHTLQQFCGLDGQYKYCFVSHLHGGGISSAWNISPDEYDEKEFPGRTLWDVDISRSRERLNTQVRYTRKLAEAEATLEVNPKDVESLLDRAEANFYLGNHDKVIIDCTLRIEEAPARRGSYGFRAMSYARLGHSEEAKRDLEKYMASSHDAGYMALRAAIVSVYLGEDEDGMRRLEELCEQHSQDDRFLYRAACAYSVASSTVAENEPAKSELYAERAVALLQQSVEQGYDDYLHIQQNPDLDSLHGHAMFDDLLREGRLDRCYAAVWQTNLEREARESHGLSPEDHLDLGRRFLHQEYRPVSISVADMDSGGTLVTASVWHRPSVVEQTDEQVASRRANLGVVALHIGAAERLWPLLEHTPDPSTRSYLVHRLAPLGADLDSLVERLSAEPDVSIRRALILSLGGNATDRLAPAEREQLIVKLSEWYREDPDPGIHGAAQWILRQWGQEDRIKGIDGGLATGKVEGARRWYVNGQQQTMVVVQGPVEFDMGSPETEEGRGTRETLHTERIDHSFAIAAKQVTVEEFCRFDPDRGDRDIVFFYPEPDCPIGGVKWYEAAAYCNWLSEQEEIPEEQWCYQRNIEGKYAAGMKMKADFLSLTGYRLPTEAEWEYACRYRARTSRYYGKTEQLLPEYAWYSENSQGRTWPVGMLKPNDLGLFDMLGNLSEWCYGFPTRTTSSTPNEQIMQDTSIQLLLGGCFENSARDVRSAARSGLVVGVYNTLCGFRPARTCP